MKSYKEYISEIKNKRETPDQLIDTSAKSKTVDFIIDDDGVEHEAKGYAGKVKDGINRSALEYAAFVDVPSLDTNTMRMKATYEFGNLSDASSTLPKKGKKVKLKSLKGSFSFF